jgi:hypothetical protein
MPRACVRFASEADWCLRRRGYGSTAGHGRLVARSSGQTVAPIRGGTTSARSVSQRCAARNESLRCSCTIAHETPVWDNRTGAACRSVQWQHVRRECARSRTWRRQERHGPNDRTRGQECETPPNARSGACLESTRRLAFPKRAWIVNQSPQPVVPRFRSTRLLSDLLAVTVQPPVGAIRREQAG